MALLVRYTIPPTLQDEMFRRAAQPPDYTPGIDPIRDADALARTNDAWRWLAGYLNFNWETVKPHPDADWTVFLAEPIQN